MNKYYSASPSPHFLSHSEALSLAIPKHTSCDSLATLLHRSWDDCHFGPLKPLIINLTSPDF